MGLGALASGIGYLLASRCHSLGSLTAAFALIGAGVGNSTIVPVTVVGEQLVPAAARAGDRSRNLGQSDGGHADAACARARDYRPRMAHRDAVARNPDFCDRAAGNHAGGAHLPDRREDAESQPRDQCGRGTRVGSGPMGAAVLDAGGGADPVHGRVQRRVLPSGAVSDRRWLWAAARRIIFGAKSIFVIFGTIFLGGIGDRIGARRVLAFAMLALCLSLVALLGSSRPLFGVIALTLFTIGYGTATGCTSTLVPMLLVESLGMRQFPTLMGIIGLVATVASAVGPLVTGRIFDLTGSYSVPFSMCAAIFALGAFITTLVYPAPGHDLVPIPAAEIPAAAIIPETSGSP